MSENTNPIDAQKESLAASRTRAKEAQARVPQYGKVKDKVIREVTSQSVYGKARVKRLEVTTYENGVVKSRYAGKNLPKEKAK